MQELTLQIMAHGLMVTLGDKNQTFAFKDLYKNNYDIKPYSWRTKLKILPYLKKKLKDLVN